MSSTDKRNSEKIEVETGGHYLLKLLNRKGIQFVFGTTGAGMPDIQDAMVIEKPPKWIQGLHEFVSVNAASGYALATENVGVAMIDRIVGVQNAIGAVYGAYSNAAPVAILASENLPGVPISTGAPELHYGSHMVSMLGPWVKWHSKLNSLETLPEELDMLLHHTLLEPQGPALMTFRQDLMAMRQKEGRTGNGSNVDTYGRVPDDETAIKIVDELLSHGRPTIVTSHLGRHREYVNDLIEFTHKFGVKVMEKRFFMSYPANDPLHGGFMHRYHPPDIRKSDSDLIVSADMGLLPHQTYSEDIDVIEIAGREFNRQFVYAGGDYGSSLLHAEISVVSDSGPTLKKLSRILDKSVGKYRKETIEDRISKVEEHHESIFGEAAKMAERSYSSGKLDAYSVGRTLNSMWKDDFIWVNGTASAFNALISTIKVKVPGSYFGNPSGHLGTTIGMAYGAALASKEYANVKDYGGYKAGIISGQTRPVICTVGDGDAIFGNIDSALWTCSHYGIGVVYVILNNSCWGVEWPPFQTTEFKRAAEAGDFEFLDLENPGIDFEQIAKGFKVSSSTIETIDELEPALVRAIKLSRQNKPSVIDIKIPKFTGPEHSAVD